MRHSLCLMTFLVAQATAVSAQTSKLIYSESPPVWFEAHKITAVISADGATALLPSRWPVGVRVIDIASGVVRETRSPMQPTPEDVKRFGLPGTVTAIAWLDAGELLALSSDARGVSSLFRVNTTTNRHWVVARDLDAEPVSSRIAIDRDRRHAYIALAGDSASAPEARHAPFADRDLDIYEIDLRTGSRRPLITTDADETAPFVVGDDLYWTSTRFESSVVSLPFAGGSAKHLVPNAMRPSWHPNGRTLGVFYGAFRAADWALNWDGGSVELDTAATAAITALLTNYHEDFEPNWSPDGKWIAYHSNDSGKHEVYVQPFRGPGERKRVSISGGAQARWRSDGRELFYLTLEGQLVAVPMAVRPDGLAVQPGTAVPLFHAEVGEVQSIALHNYIVAPDGQSFLIDRVVEQTAAPISLILNWKGPGD